MNHTPDLAVALGLTERSVTRHDGRAVVRMSRTYATDAADLWSACTDPARLARWIGQISGDRREDGVVTLRIAQGEHAATLTIHRCDVPRHLVATWAWPGEPDSIIDVSLEPSANGGTTLTLEHLPFRDDLAVAYGGGWEHFLARLGAFVGDDVAAPPDGLEAAAGPLWRQLTDVATDDHRWPELVADDTGGAGTIRTQMRSAASRTAVWAAITDAILISGWCAPITGDQEPGGSWRLAFDGGAAFGTVSECEAERRFVTTWQWDHEPDDTEPSVLTVTLADDGDGTTLSLEHTGVTGWLVGYGAGWHAHLASLAGSLAGQPTTDADWQATWTTARTMLASN